MGGTNTLEATFRIVTPMFLGGAEPNVRAELREASIKGALRYWYRAIDFDYRQQEGRIFGGAGKDNGQAAFLLRVVGTRTDEQPWPRERYACFDDPSGPKNGIQYLGYSLKFDEKKRKAIWASQAFKLVLTFRNQPDTVDRRRIAAALWLLGHIGGLGSRSRRGFGTIALRRYSVARGPGWQELSDLQPAHGAATPADWLTLFEKGRDKIREWFPTAPDADHAVLNSNARFYLFAAGYSKSMKLEREDGGPCQGTAYEAWE